MKNNKKVNEYISGEYYEKRYLPTDMDFNKSILWMANYFKVVKDIFPNLYKYKNKKILEVGSAFCGFIEILNKEGFVNVDASDVSDKLRPKELVNKFLNIDLEKYQIKNEYDLMFAFGVLEHINNSEKVVKVVSQILKKNGTIIFSVPYPLKKHLFDRYHTNMQYPNYYTNLFNRNNFTLLSLQDVSFIPYVWRLGVPLYIKTKVQNKLIISDTFFVFKKNY